jgi:hypothetical protein
MKIVGKEENAMMKKYQDVYKKGIVSRYWKETLTIIKWLESREEYEKCDDLWKYYLDNKDEMPLE